MRSQADFFSSKEIEKNAFTMKNIDDAIKLRNHIINVLERANIEYADERTRKSLLTFVVVGGGFGGVETVGALNYFVKETIDKFYKNLDSKETQIILLISSKRKMPEISKDLSEFTERKIINAGIEIILDKHAVDASNNSIKLEDDSLIDAYTIV
jgi:NADH dehydrogenase